MFQEFTRIDGKSVTVNMDRVTLVAPGDYGEIVLFFAGEDSVKVRGDYDEVSALLIGSEF